MVDLAFGEPTTNDLVMAIGTGFIGMVILAVAYRMSVNGTSPWIPRKLIHITMGTIIGLTIVGYSNLSGPFLAGLLFLTALIYAWAHKSDLIFELLIAGSREGETKANTFFSGLMGIAAFAITFLVFSARSEIFVAAILAVSWGDAAGEVVGRRIGGKYIDFRVKGKSLEGCVAVFIFTLLSVVIAIGGFSLDTSPFQTLPQIIFIAFIVAIVELVSSGWVDNFVIPIITSILLWLLLFPSMPFPFL